MPELPEVETVVRGLRPVLTGAIVARVEARRADLRFPFPERLAERVEGRRVEGVARRAKFILVALEGGETLLAHLGMTGRFTVEHRGARDEPGAFYHAAHGRDPRHDHLVLHLAGGTRVTYNDARRFGFVRLVGVGEASPHLANLGPEPLGGAFDGAVLARAMAGRFAPLKAALLDQRRVAGLGNIYVCEALHRAGLDPSRGAGTLADASGEPTPAAHRLAAEIGAVLEEAIAAGGSTLRDYAGADGAAGAFQQRFRAYGREGEPCLTPGCGGTIARVAQAGRSTFWCEGCQPRG